MSKNSFISAVLAGVGVAILINSIIWAVNHSPKKENFEAVVTPIPEDYGMVTILPRYSWLNTSQKISPEIETILMSMVDEAERSGKCLVVSSGFRTLEQQEKVKEKYGDLAEEPGKSEHHTGLAVDFQACPFVANSEGEGIVRDDSVERPELAKDFEELPEYKWLKKNAPKYGFYQTYENETWHWKFTGEILQPIAKPTASNKVSWYGQEYCDKYSPECITASGEKFDDSQLTVACSNDYRLGDLLKITYNGKTVTARCNDRGSFEKYGRKLDLSKATFMALAPLSKGVIEVEIEKI